MIPRFVQVILIEVRCGCVIICLLKKWLRLEPLRRMIERTVPKASTNQGRDWLNQQPADRPTHWPTEVAHNCLADLTNNCLVKPKTIENGYAKELIVTNDLHGQAETENDRTTKGQVNRQPRTINRPSNQGRATHPRAVGLQLTNRTIDQMIGQTRARVQATSWGPSWSNVWLDQGLEVWNRAEAKSQSQKPWRFRRFKRLV